MKTGIMRLFLSLEEDATGKAYNEVEYVLYAKVDPAWLAQQTKPFDIEDQEQWEIKIPKTDGNANAGRMRVRRTTFVNQRKAPEYVLTVKTKAATGGETEVAVPCLVDTFEQFKTMSDRGMRKRRHLLDCPGRQSKWEVDVFFNPDGSLAEWCKIDFELKEGDPQDCPDLPEGGFTEVIRSDVKPKDPAACQQQEDFIRNLYATVFITKNPSAAA